MPEDREMTQEYAILSLLTGVLAATADAHLGGRRFEHRVRANAWDLTVEKYAEWYWEAVHAGVPREALEISEDAKANLPTILKQGMYAQAIVDAMRK